MTPNLTSARQAIQAALSHARQGMEFYSARVEALESALNQLESVEGDEEAVEKGGSKGSAARRGRKRAGAAARGSGKQASQASEPGRKRGRKPRNANSADDDVGLPTTGADFWLGLVTEEPKSAVELANEAAAVLGVKPEQKTQIQKLKQRVAPALATLVATQKVQDSGTGRERRFFKGTEQSA